MSERTTLHNWLVMTVFLLGLVTENAISSNNVENIIGNTFYVSINGSDLYPGTESKPFRTIQRAADIMQPGDICYIRNGTYRETVRPVYSGTAEAPISFIAYHDERPVVSGADVLDVSWAVHIGEIYKATTNKEFIQLFVDGQMMNEARWPNTAVDDLVHMRRATSDWGTDYSTLVDDALPPGDWNDAYVHITPGTQNNSITKQIKNYQVGDSFNFSDTLWAHPDLGIPRGGNPYWLFGTLAALDAPTEWFLDSPADMVYLWCPGDPNTTSHTIEVKQRDYAFDLSVLAHIHLEGLRIFAAGINMNGSTYCIVNDCHLKYPEYFRLLWGWSLGAKNINYMSGHHNEWKNSSIVYSAGCGIYDSGMYNKVTNCIIHDVDYLAHGMSAIHSSLAYCSEYTYNTLFNCAGTIMSSSAQGLRIEHNEVYNAGLLTRDQSNIIASHIYGAGTIIAHNYVHDNYGGHGYGIGLHFGCSDYLIHHNLIWNISQCGIITLSPSLNNEIYNNTILASCPISFGIYGTDPNQRGTKIINNLVKASMSLVMGDNAPEHHHNGDYAVYDANGWPTPSSGAIDAGMIIAGITDNYVGDAPDIGCFEVGTEGWLAGADWVERQLEGFETADFDSFSWEHHGDATWTITSQEKYSGIYSAQAGSINSGQTTTLQISLDCVSGHISFYRRVSSEPNLDNLTFYIDGVEQNKWSGEHDWERQSFYVTAGNRTFKWTYSKDSSVSTGEDTTWIDDIVFPIE